MRGAGGHFGFWHRLRNVTTLITVLLPDPQEGELEWGQGMYWYKVRPDDGGGGDAPTPPVANMGGAGVLLC